MTKEKVLRSMSIFSVDDIKYLKFSSILFIGAFRANNNVWSNKWIIFYKSKVLVCKIYFLNFNTENVLGSDWAELNVGWLVCLLSLNFKSTAVSHLYSLLRVRNFMSITFTCVPLRGYDRLCSTQGLRQNFLLLWNISLIF